MAELAAGAVSSLLGVIRNEALLLRGVRDDVQFIKEEMESMKSFLAHLARWEPPGGEHDEQVRTWMNQVRLLAQDCNNCIDLYLYRGNPDIHRARAGLRRYIWWASWFLHKLVAQHRAAEQLRQLKERARDVGERRLRYGVEVPVKSAAEASSSTQAAELGGYAVGDDEEEDYHSRRRGFIEPRTLDDYVEEKLLEDFTSWTEGFAPGSSEALSMVIVAPYTYRDVLTLAQKTLIMGPNRYAGYHRVIQVDIPAVHFHFKPLRPKEVLFYILRELKSKSQEQDADQGESAEEDLDSLEEYFRKLSIHYEKREVLYKIKARIDERKIHERLDKITMSSDTRARPKDDQLLHQPDAEQKKDVDQLDLHGIFKLLHKLPEWDDNSITKIATKLKKHMEADEEASNIREKIGGGGGGGTSKHLEEKEEDETSSHLEEGEEDKTSSNSEGEEDETSNNNLEEGEDEATNHSDERDEEANHTVEGEDDEEEEVSTQHVPIRLQEIQYAHILRQVFPKTSGNKPLEDHQQDISSAKHGTKTTMNILGEDQIKQMIHDAKQEILRELQEQKYEKNQLMGEPSNLGQNTEDISEEIERNSSRKKEMKQKMDKIKEELREQLKIKGLVDKIKYYLKDECPLVILKIDEMMGVSTWEDIRYALGLLRCGADLLIVTTTKGTHLAKEYCYPPGEPIDYSLAGLYYDTILKLTSQLKNEDNYNPQIFRDILDQCEPYEFCMKIFTHALYANPNRSNEELHKLYNNLQGLPKSFNTIAKKVFMFSYNDLPKEYKSCLLYLSIFPLGHKIMRSTLIARWVTEGLTFNEDWISSVRQANQCFDELIYRCLVYPADIGATGKVHSCVVDKLVHGFITMIARKQHIVETRLSHHLARHFSIFNDLQLRSSDKIDKFFQRLSESSRVSLLKVLDLEGSQCIGGKIQRYLKDICSKMLLLKYLSLKGTDTTELPSEINNLRELEVLDIRQTKVPAYATINVLLLKLKRLLAGHIGLNPSNSHTHYSVHIPHRIDKMINIEVLSNVKARNSENLKDIGKLWQLRKLGVVVDDQKRHLKILLQTISDLYECLRSLSITLPTTRHEGTNSNFVELPIDISSHLQHKPKLLESLSIRGTTLHGHLLPLFTEDVNSNLVKITLSNTLLNQDDMNILAKLRKLQCLRLRCIACPQSNLTFNEDEFKYLKYLLVERSNLTNITFENGAACELEKMVFSFTKIESISGTDTLPKLADLELSNNSCGSLLSSFEDAEKITKLTLRGTLLKEGDLDMLAKKPNLRCLELLDKSCDASQNKIVLKKDDFTKLNLLIVDCSSVTEIEFASESAPKLEKIIWSPFTSLSDIENLPRLKELEFNGDHIPEKLNEAIGKHKNKLNINIKRSEPEAQDQAIGDEQEDGGAARFSFFWKR